MTPNPKAGALLVLAAATLWGTTGTAQALAEGTMSSLWFGALRLLVAGVFFALYAAAVNRGRTWWPPRLGVGDVIGAGLCMACYNLAFFAGIRETGVAAGTAIALGSGPIWAGLLQSLLQRSPPSAGWWGGTLAAVVGGVLLTLGGSGSVEFRPGGVLLCLLSGASYAVYTLLNKRMVPVAPAATITFLAFSVAAAVSVPVAWVSAGAPALATGDVLGVLYTGVVTAGVAYLLFSHALRHITPATGVTLALAEPVVAFLLAALVLGEGVSAAGLAGLVLIVAGVLAVVREELRGAAPSGSRSPA